MQCMGGFCLARDKCAHYRAPERAGVEPADRLCQTRRDEPVLMKFSAAASASAPRTGEPTQEQAR